MAANPIYWSACQKCCKLKEPKELTDVKGVSVCKECEK